MTNNNIWDCAEMPPMFSPKYFTFFLVCTVASKKCWSSTSFQNLVRLSQIKNVSLPDYSHVNKVSKNAKKMTMNAIQHDDRL
jgi:hypothetical protein